MTLHTERDYHRIEQAIGYINDNLHRQPSLEEMAAAVGLSPFHFQKVFTRWAGISPKKFMQYLSVEFAKSLLTQQQLPVLEAAYATGLSSASRLHDLFIRIEGMTPGDYKKGGADLVIRYDFAESPFGRVITASTDKGLCHLMFISDPQQAVEELQARFPRATFVPGRDAFQEAALRIFKSDWSSLAPIQLHLAGTPFQIKVWESLLKIPYGALTTYSAIAQLVGNPKSSRAVGSAIGSNPIAFLIPCHRVIQATGKLGGYMWGPTRKSAMIAWEAAHPR